MVNIFGENIEEITIISERDAKQICAEQDEQNKYGVILLKDINRDPIPVRNQYVKGFLFPFTTK